MSKCLLKNASTLHLSEATNVTFYANTKMSGAVGRRKISVVTILRTAVELFFALVGREARGSQDVSPLFFRMFVFETRSHYGFKQAKNHESLLPTFSGW